MCGIAGIFNYSPQKIETLAILKKINQIQLSRGPDDSGVWQSNCETISFAHTRLSIIDLSVNSKQPFSLNNEDYVITYNGEIYNYKEVKNFLLKKNIKFKSSSDTEVILQSYIYWGYNFVNHLRGMFAFAIWDNAKKELILGRDPFSIKPLYFINRNDVFYFASQIKSILSIKNLNFKKSNKSLINYYLWGNMVEPYTMYQDIYSIEGGTLKIIKKNGLERNIKFADIKETIINTELAKFKNRNEFDEEIKTSIEETIKYHQVADVPITVALSSGLDSNIILNGILDKKKSSAITVDFKLGRKKDETEFAFKAAQKLNIKHKIENIQIENINEYLSNFFTNMDSPTNDGFNNYILTKLTKQNNSKILISGIGADEFFFGYPSFRNIPLMNFFFKTIGEKKSFSENIYKFLKTILKVTNINNKYASLIKYGGNTHKSFFLHRSLFIPDEIDELLKTDKLKKILDEIDVPNVIQKDTDFFKDQKLAIMYLEIKYYLKSKLLRDADWCSMTNSVELRTPFVDWFFFKKILPLLKYKHYKDKKNIFSIFANDLPDKIFSRKKTGFDIPHKFYYETFTNQKTSFKNPLKDWSILCLQNYLNYEKDNKNS